MVQLLSANSYTTTRDHVDNVLFSLARNFIVPLKNTLFDSDTVD